MYNLEVIYPFIMFFGLIGLVIISLVSAILDSILLGSWAPFYFRAGIIIFKKELLLPNAINIDLKRLEDALSKSIMTPLLFKQIGEYEYAFREKLFDFRLIGLRYTPIMHGLLLTSGSTVKIIGKLNWFGLFFSITFIAILIFITAFVLIQPPFDAPRIMRFLPFIFFGAFIMTMGAIYATQAYRYKKVGEYLIQTNQQTE